MVCDLITERLIVNQVVGQNNFRLSFFHFTKNSRIKVYLYLVVIRTSRFGKNIF